VRKFGFAARKQSLVADAHGILVAVQTKSLAKLIE